MVVRYACQLALIAFTLSILKALVGGADIEGALKLSLSACVGFYALGLVCGEMAERVIEDVVETEIEAMRKDLIAKVDRSHGIDKDTTSPDAKTGNTSSTQEPATAA